ncbi:hypothetical protein M422DRAFT_257345 [Sphaerobolus stellatus SS14]|uniref:Redoxin domain-containing protein n=1 Tax=Sphaerobolus stellatus (strain SS14) TaxID=990650 RepID=A0A0C9VPH6_SPHS4|nr:hypothetical protein M422DRAFT_257345 [Sphaerobolus stellatus SS14]
MHSTSLVSLFVALLSVASTRAAALERRVTHNGTATWFLQGGAAGACGTVHKDTDHVVALQTTQYDNGVFCGRTITITDVTTGKTAVGTVADECPGCNGSGSIDLSESLFEVFAPTSQGVFPGSVDTTLDFPLGYCFYLSTSREAPYHLFREITDSEDGFSIQAPLLREFQCIGGLGYDYVSKFSKGTQSSLRILNILHDPHSSISLRPLLDCRNLCHLSYAHPTSGPGETSIPFVAQGADVLAFVAANDPLVMSTWGRVSGAKDNILFLSDPNSEFASKLGLELDLASL